MCPGSVRAAWQRLDHPARRFGLAGLGESHPRAAGPLAGLLGALPEVSLLGPPAHLRGLVAGLGHLLVRRIGKG